MTDQKVLQLGWRLESLTALRDLGADVTCVLAAADDDKRAGLLDDARTVPVQDPADPGSVLAGLERYGLSVPDFDVICAPGENPLLAAAVLAGGRGAMAPRDALLLRDKDLQKRRVRAAGVPVADSRPVVHARELAGFARRRGVLKPLDGTGTVGVLAWHGEEERLDLARRLTEQGAGGPWLAEEWVEGSEVHVDGVVRDGEVVFVSVGRYLQNALEIRGGGVFASRVLHPLAYDKLYARARDLAQRSSAALRHRDGVFHMEAFEQDDRLVFGEYAGRIPGGEIAAMVRHQHGVDLDVEWARALLGLAPSATPSVAPTWFGWVSLFTPGGVLESCPGEDEVAGCDGVRQVSVRARPGDLRPDPAKASNVPAALAVVEGADEEQVVQRMRRMARWFPEESVVRPEDARGTGTDTGGRGTGAGTRGTGTGAGTRGGGLTHLPDPPGVAPSSGYTHVVSGRGRLAAIAGQMAFDTEGELVGPGDPVAQARQVFTNMERCLAAAGATFDDVVKLTYYVTDIAFVPDVLAVRDEFVGTRRPPASTVVQVVALYRPDLLLEVDALALTDTE
ncbi:Rid family hydrolase [Streptomyces lavendulocolor]|uniref:Rid family hydrolase n=1 Tax=Streptomyces lavendulocolor TaxID=67316 RepID=UPI003F4D0A5F